MSISDILDDSWLQEQQRIQDIKHNYCKENMNSITIHSLFVNKNKHLDKIVNSEVTLVESDKQPNLQYIPKNTISQLIQQNKHSSTTHSNKSQYKLLSIASFFVTLEPEHIQSYSKSTDITGTSDFFRIHPSIDDIIVPPSIFIFHKINAIFLIYQEHVQSHKKYTIKSILKTTPNKNAKKVNTKKVRIDTQLNESYVNTHIKHKKTRRNVNFSK
jgi:hypothetical protein|tara:strand:- start:2395 stop:3039 length:645 start_codon:yes stop_codon:yes gene_type:complete